MLSLEYVSLTFGDFALTADFNLAGPGVTAIIGPSGGGKSTLLSLIAGFHEPDEGRLTWNSTDLTGVPPGLRPAAMLFQDNNLFPHLDCITNVALGASPTAKPPPDILARARTALETVGLAGFENRKPGGLSGGQQSRVALARLLLTDRPLVLMDEPFSALGPAQRREMLELVKALLPEATILMVTHDPEDAQETKHTIVVAGGKVSQPRSTEALFADPPPDLDAYLR